MPAPNSLKDHLIQTGGAVAGELTDNIVSSQDINNFLKTRSLKQTLLDKNITPLVLNSLSLMGGGSSFLASGMMRIGGISAADIALGASLYKDTFKEAINALTALKQLSREAKAKRHKTLATVPGLSRLLRERGIIQQTKPIPGEEETEPEGEQEAEEPIEEETEAAEEAAEEEGGAPEGSGGPAASPGGGKTSPAPAPGAKTNDANEPAAEEGAPAEGAPAEGVSGEELPDQVPEDEQGQTARDLKEDQKPEQAQPEEDQPDTAPDLKEKTPAEGEQPTRRELDDQQREGRKQAKAREKAQKIEDKAKAAKKKQDAAGRIPFIEKGVEDIEIGVEKSGAIKGTEDYWWVCVDNLELVFEGEVFTPAWAFIYIHVHAMAQFLGLPGFQKFGRPLVNYSVLLILDAMLSSQFLIQAAIILAIAYIAKHPLKLVELGFSNLQETFGALTSFFTGDDSGV